jgi:hypothetical protein
LGIAGYLLTSQCYHCIPLAIIKREDAILDTVAANGFDQFEYPKMGQPWTYISDAKGTRVQFLFAGANA